MCRPSLTIGWKRSNRSGKKEKLARFLHRNVPDALGGLPEESRHCALLATDALREAVKDYLTCKNEPWEKPCQSRQRSGG
jgi:hypothetical protein